MYFSPSNTGLEVSAKKMAIPIIILVARSVESDPEAQSRSIPSSVCVTTNDYYRPASMLWLAP